jgi:hypothetical protein
MSHSHAIGIMVHQYRHPVLTKAQGKPTALWLLDVEEQLLANAVGIPNPDAVEAGWCKLVMDDTDYSTSFPNCTFACPTLEGGQKKWNRMREVDNELKNQLLTSFDAKYLGNTIKQMPVAKRRFGLTSLTTLEIMLALKAEYGDMSTTDIEENRERLNHVADSTKPIEDMWEQVQRILDTAERAGGPDPTKYAIPEHTVQTLVMRSMTEDKGYKIILDMWALKPKATRKATDAWTAFQEHCHDMEEERTKTATVESEGFAGSTITERHKPRGDSNPPTTSTVTDNDASPPAKRTRTGTHPATDKHHIEGRDLYYCWSHGLCWHNSLNCKHPKDGHKTEATLFNHAGGSTRIAESIVNPRTREGAK